MAECRIRSEWDSCGQGAVGESINPLVAFEAPWHMDWDLWEQHDGWAFPGNSNAFWER